jgi:hypothetical protein
MDRKRNQKRLLISMAGISLLAVVAFVLLPRPSLPPCVTEDTVTVTITALSVPGRAASAALDKDPVGFGGKRVGVQWILKNGFDAKTQLKFGGDGIQIVSGALQGASRYKKIDDTTFLVCFTGQQADKAQGKYDIKFESSLDGGPATKWKCDPTIINDMRGDGPATSKDCTSS